MLTSYNSVASVYRCARNLLVVRQAQERLCPPEETKQIFELQLGEKAGEEFILF